MRLFAVALAFAAFSGPPQAREVPAWSQATTVPTYCADAGHWNGRSLGMYVEISGSDTPTERYILIRHWLCASLEPPFRGNPYTIGLALLVLGHERAHAVGIKEQGDDAAANCMGIFTSLLVARKIGMPAAKARRSVRAFLEPNRQFAHCAPLELGVVHADRVRQVRRRPHPRSSRDRAWTSPARL